MGESEHLNFMISGLLGPVGALISYGLRPLPPAPDHCTLDKKMCMLARIVALSWYVSLLSANTAHCFQLE